MNLDVHMQRATSQESLWRHWRLPSTHKLLSCHWRGDKAWEHWRVLQLSTLGGSLQSVKQSVCLCERLHQKGSHCCCNKCNYCYTFDIQGRHFRPGPEDGNRQCKSLNNGMA